MFCKRIQVRKMYALAQSDVQQHRIVLVKSHLAKIGFFFFFFSSPLPLKDKERLRHLCSYHSQFSYRAATSDMNYCTVKPVAAAHVQYSNY